MSRFSRLLNIFHHGQRFDLPFHVRLGTEFIVFLTALMTVLCLLSVTASLSLTQLAKKWTSGLENTLTVEIPHSDDQDAVATKILSGLQESKGVKAARLMAEDDMSKLLAPWLGSAADTMKDLPLPSLITIELKDRNDEVIQDVTRTVRDISSDAQVDAHEQWLTDLVKFTRSLKVTAILIMISIGLVTSLTVAGAVRSRMAIHHTELELLHIMGADDSYITKQFQRYILWMAGKGVLLGLIVTLVIIGSLQLISMTSSQALPALKLTILQFLSLPIAALILLFISAWAARITASKVLKDMP
jgi:cell division transport system permease protein